jgi:L-rhamnose mutarotase
MERMGLVIKLKAEVIPEYKRIHQAVWPEILRAIAESNIRNYTIFLREPENLLFAYWEYHGADFAADMTKITVNAVTPAAVRTAIFDQMTDEFIAFMLSKIPMGRFGTVDEVAALICWLASEECSFTTGAVFDVSGGRATY